MRVSAHNRNIETGRFYNLVRHERVCSMCNLNVVKDEYHFILQCEKYIDVRRRYLKKYYWQMPSCFKLVQLLSVRNKGNNKITELRTILQRESQNS